MCLLKILFVIDTNAFCFPPATAFCVLQAHGEEQTETRMMFEKWEKKSNKKK